jgi:hypothetical protein
MRRPRGKPRISLHRIPILNVSLLKDRQKVRGEHDLEGSKRQRERILLIFLVSQLQFEFWCISSSIPMRSDIAYVLHCSTLGHLPMCPMLCLMIYIFHIGTSDLTLISAVTTFFACVVLRNTF